MNKYEFIVNFLWHIAKSNLLSTLSRNELFINRDFASSLDLKLNNFKSWEIRINGLISILVEFMFFKEFVDYYFKKVFIKLFNVPKWHLSILKDKKYAMAIIKEINKSKSYETVVEIGCGMGDIIRNLNFRKKFGFDINRKVLFGAFLLDILNIILNQLSASRLTNFKKGDLENFKFHKKIDVIILVNWIHNLPQDKLNNFIIEIVKSNLNSNGIIVFDCILNNRDYKFNHNHFDLIKNSGLKLDKIFGPYNYNRFVYFYKK